MMLEQLLTLFLRVTHRLFREVRRPINPYLCKFYDERRIANQLHLDNAKFIVETHKPRHPESINFPGQPVFSQPQVTISLVVVADLAFDRFDGCPCARFPNLAIRPFTQWGSQI